MTTPAPDPWDTARRAVRSLASHLGAHDHEVAIVLGSGWAPAVAELGDVVAGVAMADVPGFPAPSVTGHAGRLASVDAGGRRVLVLEGRAHLYEGHAPAAVVHGVRVAVLAGARTVILTNAAGSLRADFPVGSTVLVADHLNLTGQSPLSGPPPPDGTLARFVDLSDLYSARLRAVARGVAPSLPEGVYAALPGPHFETPAEIRMLVAMGADLVGMSTVLEAIAARHLGADVLALSLVTNLAAGLAPAGLDHEELLAVGEAAAAPLGRLLRELVLAIAPP